MTATAKNSGERWRRERERPRAWPIASALGMIVICLITSIYLGAWLGTNPRSQAQAFALRAMLILGCVSLAHCMLFAASMWRRGDGICFAAWVLASGVLALLWAFAAFVWLMIGWSIPISFVMPV